LTTCGTLRLWREIEGIEIYRKYDDQVKIQVKSGS